MEKEAAGIRFQTEDPQLKVDTGAGNQRLFEEPYAGKPHVRFC